MYALVDAFITNTQFLSNTAQTYGGGVEIDGNAFITSSTFSGNQAGSSSGRGGGAYVDANASILNSLFTDNWSNDSGGGIFVYGDATFINSTISKNTASKNGGGAQVVTRAWVDQSTFSENIAGYDGAGLYIAHDADISNSTFISNTATTNGFGGGASVGGAGLITKTRFIANSASNGGGGLAMTNAPKGSVSNSLFARNLANSENGDAIYIWGNSGLALINCAASTSCAQAVNSVDIVFNTIASPTLAAGSAIFVSGNTPVPVYITDTIITNHSVGISITARSSVVENYNYFDGNTANIVGTVTSGANHPTGAQAFQNPAGDDYRLVTGSPAINTGTDVGIYTDFFNNTRPSGSGFDIGYHEFGLGTVIVQKVVVGTPPTDLWAFQGPFGGFSFPAAGGAVTLIDQNAGPYFITETTKSGFVPSASCTNGASGTNGVTFDLTASTTITCTFTNSAFTPTPTSTPTNTPTATPTQTNTPTPTSTSTPTPTPTTPPTAIELAGFCAETTSAAKCGNPNGAECVTLSWQTLREVNTAGFVLVRGSASSGRAGASAVSGLIQSEGTSGASYSWQDTSAQPGQSYAYWLSEVNADGTTREFGPIFVRVDGAVR